MSPIKYNLTLPQILTLFDKTSNFNSPYLLDNYLAFI